MGLFGIEKFTEPLGKALSVFDFSYFISGAVTMGFVALDMHYYGHNGPYILGGWLGIVLLVLATYVCGLMSWSIGKTIRWWILRLILWKKDPVSEDFERIYRESRFVFGNERTQQAENTDLSMKHKIDYTSMWIELEKNEMAAPRLAYMNRMWVMTAVFEGLITSWIVGLIVYLDGWLIGGWIKTGCIVYNIIPILILLVLVCVSFVRATEYARGLIREVIAAYHMYCEDN